MSAFEKHPAYLLALHAIHGAQTAEALDDVADLCTRLWESMRPMLMDATDLRKLEDDIDWRRAELAEAVR